MILQTHAKTTEVSYWAHPRLREAPINSASPSVTVCAHVKLDNVDLIFNETLH